MVASACRLSIDDYGTGCSSTGRLLRYAIDELTVDRTFVMHMDDDPEDAVLVRGAIEARRAQPRHVGRRRGVEGAAHVAALHELGCDVAQGYHYAQADARGGPDRVAADQRRHGAGPTRPASIFGWVRWILRCLRRSLNGIVALSIFVAVVIFDTPSVRSSNRIGTSMIVCAEFRGQEVHLDLEAVAVGLDPVQADRLQRLRPPDLEPGGQVADPHLEQGVHIQVGPAAQRPPVQRPLLVELPAGHVT